MECDPQLTSKLLCYECKLILQGHILQIDNLTLLCVCLCVCEYNVLLSPGSRVLLLVCLFSYQGLMIPKTGREDSMAGVRYGLKRSPESFLGIFVTVLLRKGMWGLHSPVSTGCIPDLLWQLDVVHLQYQYPWTYGNDLVALGSVTFS